MEWLSDPQTWIAFITLIALDLVVCVDNIIFISILAGKLPHNQQHKARQPVLHGGCHPYPVAYFAILDHWSDEPFLSIGKFDISGRDVILILGGLFLMGKATLEIHSKLEGEEGNFLRQSES